METYSDCDKCMQRNDLNTRQLMGCGYEQPHEMPDLVVTWMHVGMRGAAPDTCPGYATRLPEVVEASWARSFFEKGSLAQWTDEPVTELTREAIKVLSVAASEAQSYELEDRSGGGTP